MIAYFTDQFYPVHKGIKGLIFYALHIIFSIIFRNYNYDRLYEKIEVCCKKHQEEKLLHVSCQEQLQKWDCVGRRARRFFTDLIWMPFESIQIPVAREYGTLLQVMYGKDYMQPPQDKATAHGQVQFDTRNAYVNYIQ